MICQNGTRIFVIAALLECQLMRKRPPPHPSRDIELAFKVSVLSWPKLGSHTGRQTAELGIWTEVNPKPGGAADFFAQKAAEKGGGYPIVKPLVHRASKPGVIRLPQSANRSAVDVAIADAWDRGFDALRVIHPDGSEWMIVKNANQLRSPFARFDPAKRNSADLLAGIGGLGVVGSAVVAEKNNTDGETMP